MLSLQFERDGYLVFEDFFNLDEVAEMHKAGRHLCNQAPKEDRKVFSTTESEGSQVGVLNDSKYNFFMFSARFCVSMISLDQNLRGVLFLTCLFLES